MQFLPVLTAVVGLVRSRAVVDKLCKATTTYSYGDHSCAYREWYKFDIQL